MKIIECIHTESKCYKSAQRADPVGIVVHSTGVNQKKLARYVQPSLSDPKYSELIKEIGYNKNRNSWNRAVNKSTHYMIGVISDGSVAVARMLPESYCAWGVGKGKKGSYNYPPNAHIQFECCEDGLRDKEYFDKVIALAAELCADICRRYSWGSERVISHKEAYKKGYASNHRDIDHWLSKFGLTMNDFRYMVDKLINEQTDNGKECEEKAQEKEQVCVKREPVVGDTVNFKGTLHYSNSGKKTGKKCKGGLAVITRIYRLGKAKHPYHIKAVPGCGSNVYGWVDECDIEPV